MAGYERVVDDGHSVHARARYSLGAVSGPRRNVELKAVDPDPARTLERALASGASDEGVIVQRDTYFRVASGRLKLREEEPGEAHLISYARPDDADVRVSSYRVVPADSETLAALTETLGVDVVVEKRRHLLLWETVRIHLDEVTGLGSFVELEAVADPDSDLAHEHAQIGHLRAELGIEELREGSYSDAIRNASPDPELLRLAREAAGARLRAVLQLPRRRRRAHRRRPPLRGRQRRERRVPAGPVRGGLCARRDGGRRRRAGRGGRRRRAERGRSARRAAAAASGCASSPAADAPIHLADLERVRRTTSLAELLPLSFGPESLG